MATWDAFYPHVLIEVPGASLPLVDQKLCLAAREFCMRSNAWTTWMDPITPTSSGASWDFILNQSSELVKVIRATIGTDPGDGDDIEVLADNRIPSKWHTNYSRQYVRHDHLDNGNTQFTLFLTRLNEPVNLLMSVMPTLSATSFDSVLSSRHADAIAAGAKAMLQSMPGQPFSDLGSAQINTARFEAAVHRVANEAFIRRPSKRSAKVPIA